jgi:hypothetical protein
MSWYLQNPVIAVADCMSPKAHKPGKFELFRSELKLALSGACIETSGTMHFGALQISSGYYMLYYAAICTASV